MPVLRIRVETVDRVFSMNQADHSDVIVRRDTRVAPAISVRTSSRQPRID